MGKPKVSLIKAILSKVKHDPEYNKVFYIASKDYERESIALYVDEKMIDFTASFSRFINEDVYDVIALSTNPFIL